MTDKDFENILEIYDSSICLFHIAFDVAKRLFLNRKYVRPLVTSEDILESERIINQLKPNLMVIGKMKFIPNSSNRRSYNPNTGSLLYDTIILPFGDKGPSIDARFLNSKILAGIRNLMNNNGFTQVKVSNDGFCLRYSNFKQNSGIDTIYNVNHLKLMFAMIIVYIIKQN